MRLGAIMLAKKEAKRLLDKIAFVIEKHGDELPIMGSPETAALRRASMDLTRALAELRKP